MDRRDFVQQAATLALGVTGVPLLGAQMDPEVPPRMYLATIQARAHAAQDDSAACDRA